MDIRQLHPSLPLNNVARIRGQNPETLLGLIRDVGARGRGKEGVVSSIQYFLASL